MPCRRIEIKPVTTESEGFREARGSVEGQIAKFLGGRGQRTADSYHRELGKLVWDHCGILRTAEGLAEARGKIQALQAQFENDLRIPGGASEVNQELERAGRVADFFGLADLMCRDARERNESCGGHFREEYQTPEGEALRDDENFSYAAAWEWNGPGRESTLHKEPLVFENVSPSQRSYK